MILIIIIYDKQAIAGFKNCAHNKLKSGRKIRTKYSVWVIQGRHLCKNVLDMHYFYRKKSVTDLDIYCQHDTSESDWL